MRRLLACFVLSLSLLIFRTVSAAVLFCPSGQLSDDLAASSTASTNVVQPGAVTSFAIQYVYVSGTSARLNVQQCCTPNCGTSGDWATHTAGATPTIDATTTNVVVNIANPACQYRAFMVTSTGAGTADIFFRCGAELH